MRFYFCSIIVKHYELFSEDAEFFFRFTGVNANKSFNLFRRFCSAIKDGEIGKGLILYDYCIGCIDLIVVKLVVIGQYIRCNCFFR